MSNYAGNKRFFNGYFLQCGCNLLESGYTHINLLHITIMYKFPANLVLNF